MSHAPDLESLEREAMAALEGFQEGAPCLVRVTPTVLMGLVRGARADRATMTRTLAALKSHTCGCDACAGEEESEPSGRLCLRAVRREIEKRLGRYL